MEFYRDGDKLGELSEKPILGATGRAVFGDKRELQMSLFHIWATLLGGLRYLNQTQETNYSINDWSDVGDLVMLQSEGVSDKVKTFIDTAITKWKILKVMVTDRIEGENGLEEWLRKMKWDLDISQVQLGSNDFAVAAYSSIPEVSWSKLMFGSKSDKFDYHTKVISITGVPLYQDKFGHNVGIYKLKWKGLIVTVRITDLTFTKESYSDIMKNHRTDKDWKKVEGTSGFAMMPFRIPLNASTMRHINGAFLGSQKVTAIAAKGYIEVHEQTACNYMLQTLAIMQFRSGPSDIGNEVKLYHTDNNKKHFGTFLVEVFINGTEILSAVGDENDFNKR